MEHSSFYRWLASTASSLDTACADSYAMAYEGYADSVRRGTLDGETLRDEIAACLFAGGNDGFVAEMLDAMLTDVYSVQGVDRRKEDG